MLLGFKFGDFPQICQFAKLKTSQNFPAIRHTQDYDQAPNILKHHAPW